MDFKSIAKISFCFMPLLACGPSGGPAGGPPPMRNHDETKAQDIALVPANVKLDVPSVSVFEIAGDKRRVRSNDIPNHLVGQFPNAGNPNTIREQDERLEMPLTGTRAAKATYGAGWVFGVANNGVLFDPFAAEFWHGDPRSGWNYDAHGGAVALGLDANHAHVQPDGTYHYHGTPLGALDGSGLQHLGYAADGYPIYFGAVNGESARPSYRLKSGNRHGGDAPSGAYDGAFVEDYEYVAGLGNLDQCNGANITSPEYPNGTYAYFITSDFPAVPRCFVGTPDRSFQKGPGPMINSAMRKTGMF